MSHILLCVLLALCSASARENEKISENPILTEKTECEDGTCTTAQKNARKTRAGSAKNAQKNGAQEAQKNEKTHTERPRFFLQRTRRFQWHSRDGRRFAAVLCRPAAIPPRTLVELAVGRAAPRHPPLRSLSHGGIVQAPYTPVRAARSAGRVLALVPPAKRRVPPERVAVRTCAQTLAHRPRAC